VGSPNVDLVRSIYEDWERGDFFNSVEWVHPEIEFVMVEGPSPGAWTGLARVVEVWRDWMSTWEGLRIEAEEYRELDDERVLVLVRFIGRGKMSGLEIGHLQSKEADLFQVRDGKVTRWVAYWDRDRALADFGLTREARFSGS